MKNFVLLLCVLAAGHSAKGNGLYKDDGSSPQTQNLQLFGKTIAPHPRLLFTTTEEETLVNTIGVNPLFSGLRSHLRKHADSLLTSPLLSAPNNLTKSREHVYRMITLSLAHRLFGEKRYLDKAIANLMNICAFPSWNPEHYLDVAETTTAVAIGYDWLYHDLDEKHRAVIVEAIEEKALKLALPVYRQEGNNGSWAKRETNWNVVCNSGMIMGALAIAESNVKLAEEIIRHAVKYPVNCIKHYAPDGVCYEGPGYWEYTNIYLAIMLDVLETNIGHSFGIADLDGVSNTAIYYINALSPSKKVFNFANSSAFGNNGQLSSNYSPAFFYFSKRWQQPQVAGYYHEQLREVVNNQVKTPQWHFFLAIPWFDLQVEPEWRKMERLAVFKNVYNPIAVLNGSMEPADECIYLAIKGGAPNQAHQQLDVGHFIVETDGIRWLEDLGSDHYHLPGFWDYSPNGQRWKYFRNTNFSHNTIAIDDKIQYSYGRGYIERFAPASPQPFAVFNMTGGYEKQVQSALRGVKLIDKETVLIQDDISLNRDAQKIIWSAITSADISIVGNAVTLRKGGKQFHIKVLSPKAQLRLEEAKPYTEAEKPITGYNVLKIEVDPALNEFVSLRVAMGRQRDKLNDTYITQADINDWHE